MLPSSVVLIGRFLALMQLEHGEYEIDYPDENTSDWAARISYDFTLIRWGHAMNANNVMNTGAQTWTPMEGYTEQHIVTYIRRRACRYCHQRLPDHAGRRCLFQTTCYEELREEDR